MAISVQSAFAEFRACVVDLDPTETDAARSSRDYLIGQLKGLPNKVSGFPRLSGVIVHFGSFARKTKTRPLDDIDLMVGLLGGGLRVVRAALFGYSCRLQVATRDAPLVPFADDQGYVNSTRILYAIKSSLGSIPSYRKAEIRKNMQAVTLNLSSYPWVFDIVPHVARVSPGGGVSYYLIPDGCGDWMKTNPRIDAGNITRVNGQHNGQLLAVLRLLKYWNRRTHKPCLRSYHFETLVLNVFSQASRIATEREAVCHFFRVCRQNVLLPCSNPQGLGRNPDWEADWETKKKVASAMATAATHAERALVLEKSGNHKDAIAYWGKIFGPGFPSYG